MYGPSDRDDDGDECGCSMGRTVCAYHREMEEREKARPYDARRDRAVTDEEVATMLGTIGRGKTLDEIDDSCPKCALKMVIRHGPHGAFLGCCMFPKCKGSRKL